MEDNFIQELQELQNLETAGTLDDAQQSRLVILNKLDEAEKTADKKSKDLDSALAQKEHFRTKFEESEKKGGGTQAITNVEPKEAVVSIGDLHALRNVHEDDITDVQEYAKFKNISIRESLNSSVVKTLLAEKEEHRKTAQATSTNKKIGRTSVADDEEILEKAKQGELADPEKMAELRQKQRFANRQAK